MTHRSTEATKLSASSFTPEVPAERNDRGFITANPTPWDKAAQYHADKAKEAAEVGDKQATPFYSISHNGALLAVSIQGKEVAFN